MNHRTRGIVIALASGTAGGLLPAAVSAGMIGTHLMAAGLGAVVLMNAFIAFIHIKDQGEPNRSRSEERKMDAKSGGPQAFRTSVKAADQSDAAPAVQADLGKVPLNFPVYGWYATG